MTASSAVRAQPDAPDRACRPKRRSIARWAILGIIGELTFTVAWMVGDALAGPGYRPMRDDISDLGASTATHPWVFLIPQALAGATAIAFALFALRPALAPAGRIGVVGAWLSAAASIQDVSDAVFRLPCRAADGCSSAQVTAGWRGQVHADIGLVCLILSFVCALVLARAYRRLPDWQLFVRPTLGMALLIVDAVFVVGSPATAQIHGLAQRVLVVLAGAYGIWTAQRVYSLHRDVSHP